MPDFDPSMQLALDGLMSRKINPSVRHMVIISDGDPTPPKQQTVQAFIDNQIPVSTVAIGSHSTPTTLQDIAAKTGGKFYHVPDADGAALPRIIQRETRRIAKPLIREYPSGMPVRLPQTAAIHPVMAGISSSAFGPITGYVLTTKKSNPLVETLIEAAAPETEREHNTIAAVWQYGAGRTGVVTTDGGQKWATSWMGDADYDKFYAQLIQYLMRPSGDSGEFVVHTEASQGRSRVVVTAMDRAGEAIDFLNLRARGVGPNNQGFDIRFQQIAPGRYSADFASDQSGNYLFSIFPGKEYSPILSGITAPTSAEYFERESNTALLSELAGLTPAGGASGVQVAAPFGPGEIDSLLGYDPFRRSLATTFSVSDMWPLLLLVFGFLFATDVAIRRVVPSWAWMGSLQKRLAARWSGATAAGASVERSLARLQARKDAVRQQRAPDQAVPAPPRSPPSPEGGAESGSGSQQLASVLQQHTPTLREPPKPRTVESIEDDEPTFTSKLLEAKRKSRNRQPKLPDDSSE
jgi:hypothetical protein